MPLTWNVTVFVSTHTIMRGLSLQELVNAEHSNFSRYHPCFQNNWHLFSRLCLQTYQDWPFQVQVSKSLLFAQNIFWMLLGLKHKCNFLLAPLLVKDEFEYDNQQSHSSSESHLQTIQHPPSRPGPPETFSSPALLPPSEGSSSASTSAFSTISAGPSSEQIYTVNTQKINQSVTNGKWDCVQLAFGYLG